jgi:hypothetical protein
MRLSGPIKVTIMLHKELKTHLAIFSDAHWTKTYCTDCVAPDCILLSEILLKNNKVPLFIETTINDEGAPQYEGLIKLLHGNKANLNYIPIDARYKDMLLNVIDFIRTSSETTVEGIAVSLLSEFRKYLAGQNSVYGLIDTLGLPIALLPSAITEMHFYNDNTYDAIYNIHQMDLTIGDTPQITEDAIKNLELYYASVITAQVTDFSALYKVRRHNIDHPVPLKYMVVGGYHATTITELLKQDYDIIAVHGNGREQCIYNLPLNITELIYGN